MYARKFVPQNPDIAFSVAVHDYCIEEKSSKKRKREQKTNKTKENNSEKVEYIDVDVFVEENSVDTEPNYIDDCEIADSCAEIGAVQVDSVDSGISVDDYVRRTNTELRFEIVPGKRMSSKVLYTHDEHQIYLINSKSTIGEGWKCYYADENDCRARLHIRNGKCFIANEVQHNHSRPDQEIINMNHLNEVKAILRSVSNRLAPRQVFEDVLKR